MKIKIVSVFLMVVILALSGCALTRDNADLLYLNELKDYTGEWVVKEMIATPRVGIVANGYALENSDIIGEKIKIFNNGIIFRSEKGYVTKTRICDEEKIESLFNITYEDAQRVCGNYGADATKRTTKGIYFSAEDGQDMAIGLYVREDGTLTLSVGEKYEYIGFYELESLDRKQKHNNGVIHEGLHQKYEGKYEVGELEITTYLGDMTPEYKKANTQIPGENIVIEHGNIIFMNDVFSLYSIKKMEYNHIKSHFSITDEEASYLCGKSSNNNRKFEGDIELYRYCTDDYTKRITIVILDNKDIMLWLGEQYTYTGFYKLKQS